MGVGGEGWGVDGRGIEGILRGSVGIEGIGKGMGKIHVILFPSR